MRRVSLKAVSGVLLVKNPFSVDNITLIISFATLSLTFKFPFFPRYHLKISKMGNIVSFVQVVITGRIHFSHKFSNNDELDSILSGHFNISSKDAICSLVILYFESLFSTSFNSLSFLSSLSGSTCLGKPTTSCIG